LKHIETSEGIHKVLSVKSSPKYKDKEFHKEKYLGTTTNSICLVCLKIMEGIQGRIFCDKHVRPFTPKQTKEEKQLRKEQIKEAKKIMEAGRIKDITRKLRQELNKIKDRKFNFDLVCQKLKDKIEADA